jgi:hypothetical protein
VSGFLAGRAADFDIRHRHAGGIATAGAPSSSKTGACQAQKSPESPRLSGWNTISAAAFIGSQFNWETIR